MLIVLMQFIETLDRQSVVEALKGCLKFLEIGHARMQRVHRTQMMSTLQQDLPLEVHEIAQ
jgi:hypothetical protein